MLVDSGAPMQLGETLTGTDADGNLINKGFLGSVYTLARNTAGASDNRGNKTRPAQGRTVQAVCLRNTSGTTLYGKRIGRLKQTAGYDPVQSVDGYAASLAQSNCVVIDDQLPSGGVASNDIFWGIIRGPAIVLTPVLAGADFNGDIAVGAALVAATGTTTGATSCGRIANFSITNATAGQTGSALSALNAALNLIGVALSARTTGETAADLLIDTKINF